MAGVFLHPLESRDPIYNRDSSEATLREYLSMMGSGRASANDIVLCSPNQPVGHDVLINVHK